MQKCQLYSNKRNDNYGTIGKKVDGKEQEILKTTKEIALVNDDVLIHSDKNELLSYRLQMTSHNQKSNRAKDEDLTNNITR